MNIGKTEKVGHGKKRIIKRDDQPIPIVIPEKKPTEEPIPVEIPERVPVEIPATQGG